MVCDPVVRVEVVRFAAPLARVALPREVVPSRKLIDPVGAPTVETTLAVNSTAFCNRTGLAEEESMTVGIAFAMTSVPLAVPL